jgi:hypothetical protein
VDNLRITPIAGRTHVFQCPSCKKEINLPAQQCPFCSAHFDAGAAEEYSKFTERLNEACNRAHDIGLLGAIRWWGTFGAIRSDHAGFLAAKQNVSNLLKGSSLILAAIIVILLFAMFTRSGSNTSTAPVRTYGETDRQEFHKAAVIGDLSKTQTLLREHADLVFSTQEQYLEGGILIAEDVTALYVASKTGNRELAALLLSNRAKVDARNRAGETPLHAAAEYGHRQVAELLLSNKADVNARDHARKTPLHLAAQHGERNLVELLLLNKADVNARDDECFTPLINAAHGDIYPAYTGFNGNKRAEGAY